MSGDRKLVFVLALVGACSKSGGDQKQPPPPPPPAASDAAAAPVASSGWYRAVVGEKQGTAIPFFIQIPAPNNEALVANGPDRIHARLESGLPNVAAAFDILNTKLSASADAKGALDGTWSSTSKSWGKASLSFHAEPVAGPDPALRFPSKAGGPDPSGVWKVNLTKAPEMGKLTLRRNGTEVTGTFAFQTGNIAFLAGNQDGKTLRLSAFDGASPYLVVAELDDAGKTFKGNWTAGQSLDWKETLDAQKTDDFELELQEKLVATRPKLKIPQLSKPPYAGNPVIVELGGSWCPACGNAAAKLNELKAKHGDKLQVLTLAYEFTDDPAYNKAQAEMFKTKYKITWEVVPVDGGLEKYTDILPKELESIDASGFPITLFVARDGGVEGWHSGFPPDPWGELHQKTVADYDRLTDKIIASKAKPAH